jgi:DNA-dependent RNA polymerase auxiliary subunit epsilon
MIYGQFRSYINNLRKNIKMLNPILKNHNIYIFILTDKLKSGNYSTENEYEIRNILNEFNFNICFIEYIENYEIAYETDFCNMFFKNIKHTKGIDNNFVPTLIYRKYLLNKIKNGYIQNIIFK